MPKKINLAFFLCFVISYGFSQSASHHELIVTLENTPSSKGSILIALHTEKTFGTQNPYKFKKTKSEAGTMEFAFSKLAEGMYAIMVLQDVNNNNMMDFNFFGLPKEKYTHSGKLNRMKAPSFSSTQFMLTENSEIRLRF